MLDWPSGSANDYGVVRHVVRHYSIRTNDSAISNRHARENAGVLADPHIVSNADRRSAKRALGRVAFRRGGVRVAVTTVRAVADEHLRCRQKIASDAHSFHSGDVNVVAKMAVGSKGNTGCSIVSPRPKRLDAASIARREALSKDNAGFATKVEGAPDEQCAWIEELGDNGGIDHPYDLGRRVVVINDIHMSTYLPGGSTVYPPLSMGKK